MKKSKLISTFLLFCFTFSFIFNSFSYTSNSHTKNFYSNSHTKVLITKTKEFSSGVNFLLEKNESETKSFVSSLFITTSFAFTSIFKEYSPLKSVFKDYEEKYSLIPLFISYRNIRI